MLTGRSEDSRLKKKVLILCYGNPGRLDDGLAAALARELEHGLPANVSVRSDYQLTVEDALEIGESEVVIFVDAAIAGAEPFTFGRVEPEEHLSFSSHLLSPGQLLALAQRLFGSRAKGYSLGIRGYEFNRFGEELSFGARRNLKAALDFLVVRLENGEFEGGTLVLPVGSFIGESDGRREV